MDFGAGGGKDLLSSSLAGADGGVDGSPMTGDVGVLSSEVECVLDRRGQFKHGVEGACRDVAICTAAEAVSLPVVGGATEELGSQEFEGKREDAVQLLTCEVANLLAGALIERG